MITHQGCSAVIFYYRKWLYNARASRDSRSTVDLVFFASCFSHRTRLPVLIP